MTCERGRDPVKSSDHGSDGGAEFGAKVGDFFNWNQLPLQFADLHLQFGVLKDDMLRLLLLVIHRRAVRRFKEPPDQRRQVHPAPAESRAAGPLRVLDGGGRNPCPSGAGGNAVVRFVDGALLIALAVVAKQTLNGAHERIPPVVRHWQPSLACEFPQSAIRESRQTNQLGCVDGTSVGHGIRPRATQ